MNRGAWLDYKYYLSYSLGLESPLHGFDCLPLLNSYVEILTFSTSKWTLFVNSVIANVISQDMVMRVGPSQI